MGILDRAKQGDAQAIASLINRSLADKGVTALVRSRQNRIDIVLQAETVPPKSKFLPLIIKGIENLGIQTPVHLYARRVGDDTAAWKQVLSAPATKSRSSALAVNVNMSQLANVKISLPEYEDVIVRFVDLQGRVKCLSSLKELVQVIGRSSFAYPAIAKNSNLRNLLDTLAEFSTLDRSGRQVLTQGSILRPGQNWQKVEIQINNQLTFLPADQSPAITVNALEEYATPQAEAFARPAGSLLDEFGSAIEGESVTNTAERIPKVIAAPTPKPESKISSKAGDWLDEFGAAVEEEQNANPAQIYAPKIDSQPVKKEPEIVPYSPISGSFLDEFTAAIDSSKPEPPSPSSPKLFKVEQKLSPQMQELIEISTPNPKQVSDQTLEQNSEDLFEFGDDDFNLSNQIPNQSSIPISSQTPSQDLESSSEDLFEFGNDQFSISNQVIEQPADQIPSQISIENSEDLFEIENLETNNKEISNNSDEDISNQLNEDLFEAATKDTNQETEGKSLTLPPLPPLAETIVPETKVPEIKEPETVMSESIVPEAVVPETITQPDLIADLFVSEPGLSTETDSMNEPVFEQFSQPSPPSEIPYNMEDLLAELQASSFIQPKIVRNSSSSESKSSRNKAR